MRPPVQLIRRAATVKAPLDQAAELRRVELEKNTSVPTAARYLLLANSDELKSNIPYRISHRFQACYHSSHKELIFYRQNAIVNTTTGEIYAPYIRKVK